jgi:hypothetical protein
MDKHPLQTMFEDMSEEAGDDALRVRSYSGRGMYGKQCLGVDTDMGIGALMAHLVRFVAGLDQGTCQGEYDVECIAEALDGMQTDSMGRGTIVYFPNVQLAVEPSDDE